jgi:hypothetical protein
MPRTINACWITVASVLACGGNTTVPVNDGGARDTGAPGAPPAIRTDVDGTKGLGTLNPTEVDKLCEATKVFAKALLENQTFRDVTCRITGITATLAAPDDPMMVTMACKMAYDTCKAVPTTDTVTGMCPKPDATCMATVAEYEACLNELPGTTSTLDKLIPRCESVNRQSLAALAFAVASIGPACQTLNSKCPGVLGGITMPPVPPRP